MFLKTYKIYLKSEKAFLMFFDIKIFPIKFEGTGFSDKASALSNLKILTPKQMLQRLSIAFAQVKTYNTSENLLNEIRQIMYFLYGVNETT